MKVILIGGYGEISLYKVETVMDIFNWVSGMFIEYDVLTQEEIAKIESRLRALVVTDGYELASQSFVQWVRKYNEDVDSLEKVELIEVREEFI